MANNLFYDLRKNTKSFDFTPWGGIDGFLKASQGAHTNATALKAIVPWSAHGVDMTAGAVSSLPFDFMDDAGKVVDSSDDWQNKIGGMENPQRILYLIAASLCGGAAYVIPNVAGKALADLQYCAPHTIQPYIDRDGLQYFDRSTDQGKTDKLLPDELLHFWLPDSDVEIGPALTHPLGTSLLAVGLLASMNGTLKTYGDRGFVPATILGAKGMPGPGEREKAEAWFNQFLRGWTNVVAKIINSDAMSIQRVGAGLEELKGVYIEITRQQAQEVGTSYGIPGGLFVADAAFASEFNALLRQWYSTGIFQSIYQTIQETFTEQLLMPNFGLRMQFRPATLDAFQDDNKTQVEVFKILVDAKVKNSIAARVAGVDLPADVKYEDLDPEEVEPQPVPAGLLPAPQDATTDAMGAANEGETIQMAPKLTAAQTKDLALWNQMALRFHRKGKGNAVDFKCKALPETIAAGIRTKLVTANDEVAINKAFEIGTVEQVDSVMALAIEINKAVERMQ